MSATPDKPRHFLMTKPPIDLDALAEECQTAWRACHALGVPPAELEARVRALVTTARGVELALRETGLTRSADTIAAALAPWPEVGE